MKYKVLIEETISEMFEVDADSIDEVRNKIRKGYLESDYVLDDSNLEGTQFTIFDSGGETPLTELEDLF